MKHNHTNDTDVFLIEFVGPIRDRRKLKSMKTYLRGLNLRDYCLFVLGINTDCVSATS